MYIKTCQQRQAHYYYDKKARDLPALEGDVRMSPFMLNGKTWEKATVSKRLDGRAYQGKTEDATYMYRWNRVDLTHEVNQADITARHAVNPENDYQEPQSARQPSSTLPVTYQKSHATRQPTPAPHFRRTELGYPNKPPNQTSVPTETRL